MKRVLIVTPYDYIAGGVETVTATLTETLKDSGFQVDKLTSDNLSPSSFYEKLMLKIFGLPFLTSREFKKLNPNDYDYIICNGEYSWGISHPGAIAYFHGSYMGLRDHSSNLSWKNFLALSWRSYVQKSGARGKKVVAVSEFLKNILTGQGITTDVVIANPVDLKKFHPEDTLKISDYVFIGRYDYFAKGLDILEKLAKRSFNISVYSFGEKGSSLLSMKSPPAPSELNLVYNQYRILLFPSRFESFGMVPAEAMAAGLPVLMHSTGLGQDLKKFIPEYIIDDFLDDKALDEKIFTIKSNYSRFSEQSRKYATEHFSTEKFKSNWMKILNA